MPGRFTFHYISILMIAYISDISPHHSFTFHHVSILIWIPENFNYAVNDNTPSSILLYVPFVSILIVYRPSCFNASMTFTFHYVSILIGVALSTGAWIEILHSIMFLFNALWLYHRKPLLCLYILLCLYFNGQINRIKKFQVRLYIPLCFYSN